MRPARRRGTSPRRWGRCGCSPPPARTQSPILQGRAQFGIGAIDFVAGHPRAGRRRPGCGDLSAAASVWWRTRYRPAPSPRRGGRGPRPALRQVQLPVDQRVSRGRGIRQIDCDLGVLDPPGGTGVLAMHPTVRYLSSHRRFVDHQNRIVVAKMIDHIGPQIVAYFVGVPLARPSRCCNRSGLAWPRRSDSVQQFLRPRSDSMPSINAPAFRAAHTGRTAARSDPAPRRSPPATDRRLR